MLDKELFCVKVDFFSHFKTQLFRKAAFKTLPNTNIVFWVSKSAFCQKKVQTNGHLIEVTTFYQKRKGKEMYSLGCKQITSAYVRVC